MSDDEIMERIWGKVREVWNEPDNIPASLTGVKVTRTFKTPIGLVRVIEHVTFFGASCFLAVGEIDGAGCYQGEHLDVPGVKSAIKIRMGEFSTR